MSQATELPSQVHGSLEGLGAQPVWQHEDTTASASGGALPSFSAYPQQSVTSAGEYLMMMPQTLEGLLGSGDESEDQMDSEWLDKVILMRLLMTNRCPWLCVLLKNQSCSLMEAAMVRHACQTDYSADTLSFCGDR